MDAKNQPVARDFDRCLATPQAKLLEQVLQEWEMREFETDKEIDESTRLFKFDYYADRLNCLEEFDEGAFTFANRISFQRFYLQSRTVAEASDYITKVSDQSVAEKRATIVCIHGLAQCSDVFFELALQMCPNGYELVMIDLEGYGFAPGTRVSKLSIEQFEHQVAAALSQADPALPCFICAQSMGCLTVNAFLGRNPSVAARLAGVIYLAPLFGLPANPNFIERALVAGMSVPMEEAVVNSELPVHRLTRNRQYMRSFLLNPKSVPYISLGLCSSMFTNINRVKTYANNVSYPYLLLLGEKDSIVNNAGARQWHSKTSSAVKEIKLFANTYHELLKEPNNQAVFEAMLQFLKKSLQSKSTKPLGKIDPKTDMRFSKATPVWSRRKFWVLLVVIYLFIGLVYATMRKQKKFFLSWPYVVILAKLLK